MISSLSIIMPLFNEEKNLELAFSKTRETLNSLKIPHEFILVDDKSTDQTASIAEKIQKNSAHVQFHRHTENQGIGGAFRTGIQHAKLDYALLLPADNPLEREDLQPYLDNMGNFDIIAGERIERTGYHPFFQFLSFAYNRILIRSLFRLPLNDVNWIQMYRRAIFTDGKISIESKGIFFFTEILVKARRKGYSIVGVPARMQKRKYGQPSIYRLSVLWKTLQDLLKFLFRPAH